MSEIENLVAKALGVKPDSWMVKAAIDAVNSYKHSDDHVCALSKAMDGTCLRCGNPTQNPKTIAKIESALIAEPIEIPSDKEGYWKWLKSSKVLEEK